MANWDTIEKDGERNPINYRFEDIQSAFLTGKISTMYKLVKRSPTKVAELLGMNYDSYHGKLLNPEKFTVLHINVMAFAFGIDPDLIHNIIQKEIKEKIKAKVKIFENKN